MKADNSNKVIEIISNMVGEVEKNIEELNEKTSSCDIGISNYTANMDRLEAKVEVLKELIGRVELIK